MKSFLLIFFVFASSLHAQDSKILEKEVEDLLPSQKEFSNLPEEKRKEFIKHFGEASRYFSQKRIFEALESIYQADKIFSKSAELINLRGSCYVEMRAFDKAMDDFKKAQEINPENTGIMFNIAEVLFVTRQWKESHDKLKDVIKRIPEERTSFARLVEFKILLCKKKLGLDEEVQIMAEKYDYQDDSPYYYYAKAALAYDDKELVKAEEWLARANRIFRDPNIIAPWQDTLIEFGYIKSFYGSDEEPDA